MINALMDILQNTSFLGFSLLSWLALCVFIPPIGVFSFLLLTAERIDNSLESKEKRFKNQRGKEEYFPVKYSLVEAEKEDDEVFLSVIAPGALRKARKRREKKKQNTSDKVGRQI